MNDAQFESLVKYAAWPVVVLAFTLIALFILRKSLAGLITRLKGFKGLRFDPPEQPQVAPESQAALAEYMRTFDNAVVAEHERTIRQSLEERGITSAADARDVLVRELAVSQIIVLFERAQTSIYDSQLKVLEVLNSGAAGTPIEILRPLFDDAAKTYPQMHQFSSFESWFGFLELYGLAIFEDGTAKITERGREFLKWRIESRAFGPFLG